MDTWVKGAEDVTAVELAGGEEVERGGEESDPGGAADRVEKEEVRIDAGMKERVEEPEEKRNAEDDGVLVGIRVGDGRDETGVKDAVRRAGTAKTKPTNGPEAPTSKRARVVRIGERMRMKAPKVPMRDGKGMKKG